MVKEIKYFIFFLIIILFIFFSVKYYISDANIKKTFKNLSSIDKNISIYESKLLTIYNDTDDVIKYLNNDESESKKKYSFWELLKSEN
tara:strand:- start:4927 stop:5190 length:264 start_codon:yes stop_codon:yes gene_type:complete